MSDQAEIAGRADRVSQGPDSKRGLRRFQAHGYDRRRTASARMGSIPSIANRTPIGLLKARRATARHDARLQGADAAAAR